MAKESWGRKRVCAECEASFYDMRRNPIACPKCGKKHHPVALLKSDGRPAQRRKRLPETVSRGAATAAIAQPAEAEAEELDDALPEGTEDEDEEAEDEDHEAEAISEERDH